ncbi:alanine racemase [Novosphingobium sp. Rr 2-17]|uniref:alanine racemase n=1 Tax=Novosphingobium sp. Rr 2-17 TaxID=555793 RepID=UPI0002698B82|nr:alanine racemase [Novosphingobium sp. Rr 2-17]EIZ80041.1 alanine racemase [Novosphingobium sp. Rr 2-17]
MTMVMMFPDTPLSPVPSPALRLDLDRDALRSNWLALDRMSCKARAGAAVKADGYGLGARQVVPVLQEAGCQDFFVAHWSEVADVLAVAAPVSVSVLHGPLTAADAAYAQATGVKPVINSIEQARRWMEAGGGRCDLMIDTGINRLGVPMSQIGDEALNGLDVDILLSHLVSSEEDTLLNTAQCRRWREACCVIPHDRASLANSGGIALGAAFHGDLTRPGIALYGGVPRQEMAGVLSQVVRPQAAILQVREIVAGDTVGYNGTFMASAPMRVGTIAIGYADGYLRCWSGKGRFLAGEVVLPVLGRVSMDMTTIDLTAAPHLREGDWVTADYALAESAAVTGLSQYELLTLLGRRFGR